MSGPSGTAVDDGALRRRLGEVQRRLGAHAGGIELDALGRDGSLRVRFTGMCAGCPFRPLTMHGTVRPALLALPGVTAVEADGARVSEEALERMRRYLGDGALEAWRAPAA